MSAHPTHVLVRAATSSSHGSSTSSIVLIVALAVGLVLLVLNGRRKQRAAQGEQTEIEIGTVIVTRFGLIATLVDRTDDYVVLQLEDGTRARFVPQIISQAWDEPVPDDPAGAELPADGDPPTGE